MVERTPVDPDAVVAGVVTGAQSTSTWLARLLLGAALLAGTAAAAVGVLGLRSARGAEVLAALSSQVADTEQAVAGLAGASSAADMPALAAARGLLAGLGAGGTAPDVVREAGIRSEAILVQVERQIERGGVTSDTASRVRDAEAVLAGARHAVAGELAAAFEGARRRGAAAIALAVLGVLLGAAGAAAGARVRGRERGQEQVRQLTELLSAAVRSTEEGILITDTGERGADPRIVFLNRSFGDMIGFLADDLIGQPLQMLRDRHMKEREFSVLEHSFSNSRSATMETVRWREDGSSLHCEWHISPVRDEAGRVTHFVSVLRDITERRRHEEALEQTARELAEANRRLKENQAQLIQTEKMAFLGQLAAGVAHEINNPVGYVMSNLETLSDDMIRFLDGDRGGPDLDPEELREMLAESRAGLAQVRDIVSRLKNFARPDEAEPELANLNDVVEGSVKMVWNQLKHRCTVHKELGDLPSILCRPGQLGQVFTNLLVNAAQAITEQGVIRIETRAGLHDITVSISDTGVGIPREHLDVLFTPFFTTKPPGQGTGLGLAVSYGIVTAHGGTIEVASRPGEGSRFTVSIPRTTPFERRTVGSGDSDGGPGASLDGAVGGR